MTEQERREHFAFLNGVATDMKESRKEIIDLLEGIKAEIENKFEVESITDGITAYSVQYRTGESVKTEIFELIDRHIKEYTE